MMVIVMLVIVTYNGDADSINDKDDADSINEMDDSDIINDKDDADSINDKDDGDSNIIMVNIVIMARFVMIV